MAILNQSKFNYLFIDVLQWSVRMLAIADSVATHACLTGIFFSFDQHREGVQSVAET